MNVRKYILAAMLAPSIAALALHAQVEKHPIPKILQQDGRYALMVDNAPFLMLGAHSNNSRQLMTRRWPRCGRTFRG